MSIAESAARQALADTVELLRETGLLSAVRELHREVWATNLDRYEPDELGDTPRSLGLLCHENFTARAVRRHQCSELEPKAHHWNIAGLDVSTPSGVLTFQIGNRRIVGMKVPPSERRTPCWDRFAVWDNESNTRLQIAKENSKTLGDYRTPSPGQGELADFHRELGRTPGQVRDFLYVWAGELASPLTAGWLTVPVLGEQPFVAVAPLWHDRDDDRNRTIHTRRRGPEGPNFDQKPATQPSVTLKPKRASVGGA
ncbi:MAG TPA: hypothetical protein VHO29_18460 [Marmoricola sp.]|nr:hypothetical protein [Marmoricola sp.]